MTVVDVVGDACQRAVPAEDDDEISAKKIRLLDEFTGPQGHCEGVTVAFEDVLQVSQRLVMNRFVGLLVDQQDLHGAPQSSSQAPSA